MLKDVKGNRMFRRVDVKVYFPDKIFPTAHNVHKSPPKKGYNSEGIDEILMNTTDQLDKLYPWWDFKMVPLKPDARTAYYAFTWAGYRVPATPAVPVVAEPSIGTPLVEVPNEMSPVQKES